LPDQTSFNFQWFSPLGISVMLFLLYGGVYILIGGLSPFVLNTAVDQEILVISGRTDTIVFGHTPAELRRDNPELVQLRTLLLTITGGLLLTTGCFHLALTWFGLRQGQLWALIALAIGGVTVLPYWFVL
jgi:hypothetical protein